MSDVKLSHRLADVEQEAIKKWQEGYYLEKIDSDFSGTLEQKKRVTRLDDIMRRPATEFNGPDDLDLWGAILYLRQYLEKGARAKGGHVPDEDIDLTTSVVKRASYRRF
jgi:hypothetical protein